MMMIDCVLVVLGAVALVHGGPRGEQGQRGERGAVGERGTTGSRYPRSVTKVLTVKNGGPFGQWGEAVFCPKYTFATGFQLEGSLYWVRHDNTFLNGIALKCKSAQTDREAIAPPEYNTDGDMTGMKNCTKLGSTLFYLSAFQLYVEEYDAYTGARNVDYTGATNIDFKCMPETFPVDYTLKGEGSYWGDVGRWSASCPLGSSICGIQSKIQEYQGENVDDSGLNDVKFFCCKHQRASQPCQGCPGAAGRPGERGEA